MKRRIFGEFINTYSNKTIKFVVGWEYSVFAIYASISTAYIQYSVMCPTAAKDKEALQKHYSIQTFVQVCKH